MVSARFLGNRQREEFSFIIRSVCCDAFVTRSEVFERDGYWIICGNCRATLDFLPRESLEESHTLRMPDMTAFMEAFAKAVQAAGTHMRLLMEAAWEKEHIVGEGTQMVDGEWKPKGFLNG